MKGWAYFLEVWATSTTRYQTNLEPDNIFCPFSPVLYTELVTQIRRVRGSQTRPVPWFSCKREAETDEFQPGSNFPNLFSLHGTYICTM